MTTIVGGGRAPLRVGVPRPSDDLTAQLVRDGVVGGLGTVAFSAVCSSAVLVLLGMLVDDATAPEESAAVAAASVAARFLVLRNWVFGGHTAARRRPA